jgi:hypothetical protein
MPVRGGRRGNPDEHRTKLPTMFAIGDPLPRGRGVFAGGNDGGMADQCDQFALTLHLQAEDAKAVLLVVEGDSYR